MLTHAPSIKVCLEQSSRKCNESARSAVFPFHLRSSTRFLLVRCITFELGTKFLAKHGHDCDTGRRGIQGTCLEGTNHISVQRHTSL